MKQVRYRVVVEPKGEPRRPVFSSAWGNGQPRWKLDANSYATFDKAGVANVRKWAKQRKYKMLSFKAKTANLIYDKDTKPVNANLASRLQAVAEEIGHDLFIREGKRTRQQQQKFWNQFVSRGYRPPLVARPGTSNHETGNAADVGVLPTNQNIGVNQKWRNALRKHGLCLPVRGETWHVEVGHTWKA